MDNARQTLAAAAVVTLTALAFRLRLFRRPRPPAGGCGGNCACGAKRKPRMNANGRE